MADIDTGWFAVPAARSRQFAHSGKMFNVVFFTDMVSVLNKCVGWIAMCFRRPNQCDGLGRSACLVRGLSIARTRQVGCVFAGPCLMK